MAPPPEIITSLASVLVFLIFLLAGVGASMTAIDSNEQVKSEHRNTYNYLIFLTVILSIQMLSTLVSGTVLLLS